MKITSILWYLFIMIMLSACATERSVLGNAEELADLETRAEEVCTSNRNGLPLPPKPFRTDGCTLFPDHVWQQCCLAHDIEYWCGGSAEQRRNADRELQNCVAETGYPWTAALMRLGTRLGGASALPTWWRWGYGWSWPEPGTETEPDPD